MIMPPNTPNYPDWNAAKIAGIVLGADGRTGQALNSDSAEKVRE